MRLTVEEEGGAIHDPRFTPAQVIFIYAKAKEEGKEALTPADLQRYQKAMQQEGEELRARAEALLGALGAPAAFVPAPSPAAASAKRGPGRPPAAAKRNAASMIEQGKFLSLKAQLMRSLTRASDRKQIDKTIASYMKDSSGKRIEGGRALAIEFIEHEIATREKAPRAPTLPRICEDGHVSPEVVQ